eukprot:gene38448-51947_t
MNRVFSLFTLMFALTLSGCGYNTIQTTDEQVKAAWAEVLNQYQRRADLVPNLVNVVKAEANFEQETLTQVVEARSKATSIQATPELINDPEAFNKFQQAQGELSGALSRLLLITENYPNLKANQGFRDLQTQLEGTENRITVARNRYIKSVQDYNVTVRSFPNNLTAMVMGYEVKPSFTVEDEAAISKPPTVDFGTNRFWLSALLALILVPAQGLLWAQPGIQEIPVPPLSAQVVDTTGTLGADQQAALIQKLQAFEAAKGSQIAVLLIQTTEPETIEQYALRVAENWKIGRKNVDDGAILVVALQDRALRIEV